MKQRMIGWLLPASVILVLASVACAEVAKPTMFNIRTYGAVGDGEALETEAVQEAIDACHEAGGGVVWIPAGRFVIGTIDIKSSVTLSLDHGAELLGSQNQADYPTDKLRRAREAGDYSDTDKGKAGPIMITGIPGYFVEDIVLENIRLSYPGHGSEEQDKRIVPEDEDRYPEQFFFGVLPAWGAYIRHAKNIEFKNVELTLRGADARQKIVLDDVEGFVEN